MFILLLKVHTCVLSLLDTGLASNLYLFALNRFEMKESRRFILCNMVLFVHEISQINRKRYCVIKFEGPND